ncbi:DNA glycosylase AlkZ-like family protein [Corynebacterium frankenforstense]|uniref:DNA glycosylase AlkZ-like family protein n=1 Tax=Corynebacterium frankenforstense TaxID=1230998 RepID=UPI0012EB48B0|nr:crosslink repair DNA glycosylase YcaQ family protein [Corynebacterium frankenforstense]
MSVHVERAQVLGHRLRVQGLLPRSAACLGAFQDSPPSSAAQASAVRGVVNPRPVRTWAMRGAPFVFDAADLPVYTLGALPPTPEGRLRLIRGVGPHLAALGLSVDEARELVSAQLPEVLAGRRVAIDELGRELAAAVEPSLGASAVRVWRSEGPHAAGQPVGEAVVHFLLRLCCLRGELAFAPREGDKAPFALLTELIDDVPGVGVRADGAGAAAGAAARAELARRFLHVYAPANRGDFATWLGVRSKDAEGWSALADELVPVRYGGRRVYALEEDVAALESAADPAEAEAAEPGSTLCLLPSSDPYLQARDRATIAGEEHHKAIWRPVGAPGAVVVAGRVVGVWRPRTRSGRFTVRVFWFGSGGPGDAGSSVQKATGQAVGQAGQASSKVVEQASRKALEQACEREAHLLAEARGADLAGVVFEAQ